MSSSVKLYVYDLSNGLAKQLSRQLTGRQIDGIWHTSVVIFDKEYFYGQGINVTLPGQSHHGSPLQMLDMGETFIDEDTFYDYITEVRNHYTADKYHLLDFNCNSFTNDVVGFLTGRSIPEFIKDLPTDFLSTPFGAALRPTIDAMYSPSRGAVPTLPRVPAAGTSASILESVATRAQANYSTSNGPPAATSLATTSLAGPVHVITNQTSFRSFLGAHKAAVAFFTSSTCAPCRIIEPVFIELAKVKSVKSQGPAKNGVGFAKIDIGVGSGHTLAAEWRVMATPTFIFFLDGNKVQEIKGANSSELKTQVDMLLFEAYPPHPHTKLSVPIIQKISFDPILFTRVTAIDAMATKLGSIIDSTTWPAQERTRVKALVNDTISPYLKGRFATVKKPQEQLPSATSTMLSSWSKSSIELIDALPVESLFPVVDLWRLLVLDPATETWTVSQPSFDRHPLSLLLASAENTVTVGTRSYVLTLLRLFANVFASPLIAQRLIFGSQKQTLTTIIIQTLLHDDAMIKAASASLLFNLSATLQRNRVESITGTTTRRAVQIDESEDWEVEVISAIIEALRREKEDGNFVHRLTAALAFVVRLSPFWSSLQTLLQVLQCTEVLESKLSESQGWSRSGGDVRGLLKDVVVLVSHST
ncbi:hypothetical protein APHAL10511_001339 [Amanita phalloides]|nr:hypothetical protein APHAL10511_001339 [Amanita phalloides]